MVFHKEHKTVCTAPDGCAPVHPDVQGKTEACQACEHCKTVEEVRNG